nr:variable surface lipoprotein [Mycoplasmopsis bovis]
MKKSKFLLLGSVASLASIPFVAAKCGETKEEKKPRQKSADKNPEIKKVKTQTKIGGIKTLKIKTGENTNKNPGE